MVSIYKMPVRTEINFCIKNLNKRTGINKRKIYLKKRSLKKNKLQEVWAKK